MVVLDARAYQIKGSGRVSEAPLDAGAPFAVVTWFDAGIDVSTSSVGSFKDLEASCDPCQRSGNIFYALRLDGLFKSVRTRAVNPPKAGMGLVGTAKTQSEFTFTDREGTLVGLSSPGFSSAFSVPAVTDFLSADRHHRAICSTVPVTGCGFGRGAPAYTGCCNFSNGVSRRGWNGIPGCPALAGSGISTSRFYDHRRLPASSPTPPRKSRLDFR